MDPAVIPTIEGGTIWLMRMMDVGDEVDLERARSLTERRGARRGAAFLRGPEKGTGGVLLASQPLDLDMGSASIDGMEVRCSVRLFDFGVASVRFEVPIPSGTSCQELWRTSAAIEAMSAIDDIARAVWGRIEHDLQPCIRVPHPVELIEDYTLFEIHRVTGCTTGEEALAAIDPARLLLAEPDRTLEPNVSAGWRKRAVHYYIDDAVVVGWNAALVIDPEGGRDVLEVLEIANTRLLELRYYDRILARELARVYDAAVAARQAWSLFRSPFVHVARRAATLFVEMTDLYDRLQGAFTLVGDAYTARLYREASLRLRLDEISATVREKLGTLASVSQILEGEVGHRRTTLLELAVVLLIVLEVVLGVMRH